MESETLKEVTVVNELGFHARAAAQIAKIAQNASAGIWLSKDGDKVDASSIIDILTLQCAKGARVVFSVDDDSDAAILADIVRLVEDGFGE